MEITLTTGGGKKIPLKSSAAFLYIYKNQFHEDPFKLLKQVTADYDPTNIFVPLKNLDAVQIYNITWALAKCANHDLPDPMEFYLQNEDFKPFDYINEIMNIYLTSFSSNVDVEETEAEEDEKK